MKNELLILALLAALLLTGCDQAETATPVIVQNDRHAPAIPDGQCCAAYT